MLEEILVSLNWALAIGVGQIESCVYVGHVSAEMEGTVVHLGPDLVVDSGLHLVFGPSGIFGSSKIIILTDKHGDWNLVNLADFDLRCLFLAVLFHVGSLSVVIVIEFATCNKLTEMFELFPRSWLRELGFVRRKVFVDIVVMLLNTLLVKVVTNLGSSAPAELLFVFLEIFASDLIHAQSLQGFSNNPSVFGNFFKTFVGSVSESDYWSQSNKKVNSLVNPSLIRAERIEHLGGSLRVTHISQFLNPSKFSDFVDLGRKVVFSQLDEAVGEEFWFVFLWVESHMLSGVIISSVISKPDIISSVCEFECWRFFWTVGGPAIRGCKKAVLHKDDWGIFFQVWTFNSVHGENISILRGDLMLLKSKTGFGDELFESLVIGLWIFVLFFRSLLPPS